MERFPEQLLNARKAAGMTQEQLADAVHVARNTISSWEHGRTQPDLETLRLLGQVLHFDFMNDVPIRKEIQTAGQFTASPPPEIPAGIAPVNQLQKKRILAIVALAVIILIVSLIVIPKRSGTPSAYKDDSGKVYTVADFKAVTPNQPGKAYLSVTTTPKKQPTGSGIKHSLFPRIRKRECFKISNRSCWSSPGFSESSSSYSLLKQHFRGFEPIILRLHNPLHLPQRNHHEWFLLCQNPSLFPFQLSAFLHHKIPLSVNEQYDCQSRD